MFKLLLNGDIKQLLLLITKMFNLFLKRKSQQDALQATPPEQEANEEGVITFG